MMSSLLRERLMAKQSQNPANERSRLKDGRERVPMSLPMQKLAVPELPGYHLHWMIGKPDRIAQAQRAGYEFVDQEEIDAQGTGLGNGAQDVGSTDLGSRVSLVAGGSAEDSGQPLRLYLMKIREAWWIEDQEALERRSEQIAETLRGDNLTPDNPYAREAAYATHTYGKPQNRNILQPKLRRTPEA